MSTFVPTIAPTVSGATRPLLGSSKLPRRCVIVGAIALVATGAFHARSQIFNSGYRQSNRTTITTTMSTSTTSRKALLGGGEGVVIDAPQGTATAALIFLHGLGDTCAGWSPVFPLLPHVMTVLPTANTMPVSLNMGMSMPSWFDLYGLDLNAKDDKAGILAAMQRVERIIDALPVQPDRIVVGGFSQGGAVALTTALQSTRQVAGVAALSSWLPLRSDYPGALARRDGLEAFMAHGSADTVVSTNFGVMSAQMVESFGMKVEKHLYPNMGHSACDKELSDLKAFLARVVPEKTQ